MSRDDTAREFEKTIERHRALHSACDRLALSVDQPVRISHQSVNADQFLVARNCLAIDLIVFAKWQQLFS